MRIALITPYLPAARNGNAHTALRWARHLRAAGHQVEMAVDWNGQPADLMVALHARRRASAIRRFAETHPDRPLVVVLTGTDLYRDIRCDDAAKHSLDVATRLVVLQDQGPNELSPALRGKTRVIYQSAPDLKPKAKGTRHFDVCVVAHLREEKDPLRAAYATCFLPESSKIRVRHLGNALDETMATEARRCQVELPRWHWLGGQSHGATRQRIARSHLLVCSSRMEGGAHVVIEAVTAGVPVIASHIPGNIGMLGVDYAGYYPAGDERALAECLHRAETDVAFYRTLCDQCAARAPLFDPTRERAAVQQLIVEPIRDKTV